MKTLTIFFDQQCGLCRRCRSWLEAQPAFVPLTFVPFQSALGDARYAGIEDFSPEKELVVVGDTGQVWQGAGAWVMCLWALREYREWSQRLSHPALLPLARRVVGLVSENRLTLSKWFGLPAPAARHEVERLSPACLDGRCTPPALPQPREPAVSPGPASQGNVNG